VPRLLVLCRHPYHLRRQGGQAWLRQELEAVLRRDELKRATLTRLRNPSWQSSSSCDWLVEFQLETGSISTAMPRGGALAELVADLRLLGMAPTVALADDADVVELRLE
jgi:hypothetical protein